MSKEIRYAGFSVLKDETLKFRTASDQKRIYQLESFGEGVSMVLLDQPVSSKSEAAKQLLAQGDRWIPEAQALFVKIARDDNPFAKPHVKKSRTVKVKAKELAEPARDRRGRVKDIEQFYLWFNTKMKPSEAERVRAEFNARVKEAYEAN